MRAARWAAAIAAAGWLLAGCGSTGRSRPQPPEPALRIWAPTIVHWSPGADRSVRFAIENGTQRTLEVPEPDASGARVAVFAEADSDRVCGVEPSEARPAEPVRLAPGDQIPVRVDLGDACRDLRPGKYRFEVSYRVPRSDGGAGIVLQRWYGTLVVEGPVPGALTR